VIEVFRTAPATAAIAAAELLEVAHLTVKGQPVEVGLAFGADEPGKVHALARVVGSLGNTAEDPEQVTVVAVAEV
jgi:hypothetical protein